MPHHYAGFADHQRRASEHGVELYLLDHPATCTRGRCQGPAIVNGCWLYPRGAGMWTCNNYCEKHLEALLAHGPLIR